LACKFITHEYIPKRTKAKSWRKIASLALSRPAYRGTNKLINYIRRCKPKEVIGERIFGAGKCTGSSHLALLAAAPAAAQWLNYPTAAVPKKPDGSPNLSAPPPRTPDGKPDISGIWTMMCPTAKGLVMCLPETYVSREFADIGRSLDGGLPYQPWAADAVKARRALKRFCVATLEST
jgi:hypothetical protein